LKIASIVNNCFTNDSRVKKQAISLTNAGYEVSVFALWRDGLDHLSHENGYQVKRVKTYLFSDKNIVTKTFRILVFSFSLSLEIHKFDIVHCHDFHPLPAILLSKLFFRSKSIVIYDAHELQSEKLALSKPSKFFIKSLEKLASPFISGFITVSESILESYNNLFSRMPKTLILNCPPKEELAKSLKFDSLLSLRRGSVKCLYQGGFLPFRGIEELLEGSRDSGFESLNFIFMGHAGITKFGKSLEKRIVDLAKKHKNIHHVKSVPMNDLLSFTSSASFGVCLTVDNCLNHKYSLPNKFFEYAMAGLPIVVSDLPEMRKLVQKYNCGVVCETVTPYGIVKSIKELLANDLNKFSKNARRMAEDHSWEVQEKKLLSLYDQVLKVPLK